MPPIQPPFISAFFNNFFKQEQKKNTLCHQSFFLSFEDALWQLILEQKISKNSVILIPEFFCFDVVSNIENHGLKCQTYEVDKYLQVNEQDFINKLKEIQPSIVIVFHAVGISNSLMKNTDWLKFLPAKSLLIEDCVHRLIEPEKLNFVNDRHFFIDSLRKVAPIQASRLFSKNKIQEPNKVNSFVTGYYRFQVFFWWLIMQLALLFVYFTKKPFANKLAQKAMQKGYDVIGDHQKPSPAPMLMTFLIKKLNIRHIKNVKEKQVNQYQELLAPFFQKQTDIFPIPFTNSDKKELRGFPLGIKLEKAEKLFDHCAAQGLELRLELNDSPWALKQKIVYLPMGPHVKNIEIEKICDLLKKYLAQL